MPFCSLDEAFKSPITEAFVNQVMATNPSVPQQITPNTPVNPIRYSAFQPHLPMASTNMSTPIQAMPSMKKPLETFTPEPPKTVTHTSPLPKRNTVPLQFQTKNDEPKNKLALAQAQAQGAKKDMKEDFSMPEDPIVYMREHFGPLLERFHAQMESTKEPWMEVIMYLLAGIMLIFILDAGVRFGYFLAKH